MILKIKKFSSVKSTNDEAIKLIYKNKTSPTLIFSTYQTGGRGTMGKQWISKKGNLFISIYFKINPKKINFDKFATLNPNILIKVLKKYSKFKIKIKWPNDLLIKKKKYVEFYKKF